MLREGVFVSVHNEEVAIVQSIGVFERCLFVIVFGEDKAEESLFVEDDN